MYSLRNRHEKLAKGSLFCLFLKLVQINFIFTDNVRILYIYRSKAFYIFLYIYISLYSDTKILLKYIPSLQKRLKTMDFHIVKMHKVKMHKDKEVNKNVKNIFLSLCDVKVSLTFTSRVWCCFDNCFTCFIPVLL